MQSYSDSDNHSQSLAHESEPSTAPSLEETFSITREDAKILDDYLDEFQEGDADVRSAVVVTAMGEIALLQDEEAPFNKVDASRVSLHVADLMNSQIHISHRKLGSGFIITILNQRDSMSSLLAGGPPEIHSTTCVGMKS